MNKAVPPIQAAVPSIATILETLAMLLGLCQPVLDLANAFFSILLAAESQDKVAFM